MDMYVCPVERGAFEITQRPGENPEYYAKYGLAGHNGIDFAPRPKGRRAPCYAPHEGYVQVLDDGNVGYGKHVIIISEPYNREGHRKHSTLAHLASFNVVNGQWIGTSDLIGIIGNTGDSSGPHLHWTPRKCERNGGIIDYNNGLKGVIKDALRFTRPLLTEPIQ